MAFGKHVEAILEQEDDQDNGSADDHRHQEDVHGGGQLVVAITVTFHRWHRGHDAPTAIYNHAVEEGESLIGNRVVSEQEESHQGANIGPGPMVALDLDWAMAV